MEFLNLAAFHVAVERNVLQRVYVLHAHVDTELTNADVLRAQLVKPTLERTDVCGCDLELVGEDLLRYE